MATMLSEWAREVGIRTAVQLFTRFFSMFSHEEQKVIR
jgi:hypothetical protein